VLKHVISARRTKLRLARAVNGVIARRRLTQDAAAGKLGVGQAKAPAATSKTNIPIRKWRLEKARLTRS